MANEIKIKVTGDSADAEAAAKRVSQSFQKVGTAVGAAAVVAGAGLIKLSNDFDKARDKIAVGTGATGQDLKDLQDSFENTFKSVPVSMDAASTAIANFNTSTGATGKGLETLAAQALNASRLTGESIEGMSVQAGKAFNLFELNATEGAAALDVVFKASQATGVPMTQLLGTLNNYGPVLKNLGLGLTESTALFGALEKSGIAVSRVMPGLNAFMRRTADEGVEDLGAALADTIEEIKTATTDTEALRLATAAFGAEGAQRLSVAIRNGTLDLEGFTEELVNSQGAINTTASQTDDWREKLTLLKNQAMLTIEPIAEIGGVALSAGGSLVLMAANMGGAIQAAKNLGPALASMGRAAMAAGPMVAGLAVALGAAFAASKLISNNSPEWVKDVEAMGTAAGQLAVLEDQLAVATNNLEKDAIRKAIASIKEQEEVTKKAAVRTAQMEDAADDAARATGDWDQKIEDLTASLDDMSGSASEAFGVLDKFSNVPTQEMLDLDAVIAGNNQRLSELELALLNTTDAEEDQRAQLEENIAAIELHNEKLIAEKKVMDDTRTAVIEKGKASVAAGGQVEGLVKSESDLVLAAQNSIHAMGGQIGQLFALESAARRAATAIAEASAASNDIGGVRAAFEASVAASVAAGFEHGTEFVPQTGLALVHQGERIIPAAENRRDRANREQGERGGVGDININIGQMFMEGGGGGSEDAIGDLGFALQAELSLRGIA